MDCEGVPVQEIAAIEVNRSTNAIVDVFLRHAHTEVPDTFSREHIHGLNTKFLKRYGLSSEKELIETFKKWLYSKPYVGIFANDSRKESELLGISVSNFQLVPWAERRNRASHELAVSYKELSIPILNRRCSNEVHSAFIEAPSSPNFSSAMAKARHGYHCALYDCLELYFESLLL